ncbi:MAG TPA: methyltransferase [Nocardioidaceae bacterium]|nr:methyltransferase [Nocardioidaceae bacterium]
MSDHYFSADPGSPERRQSVEVTVWGRRMSLTSASGVFSAGRLDLGTGVLLRTVEPPTTPGRFLDLGCGYGVIACALALASDQAEVWAVDVNERALRLCGENAAALGVDDRVRAVAPSAVPEDIEFDEIWSNPPIRIGKSALHDLLLEWLPRLTPGGHANLVVGRNLGADSLQRWLDDQGYRCQRRASAKGFRVLRATRASDR